MVEQEDYRRLLDDNLNQLIETVDLSQLELRLGDEDLHQLLLNLEEEEEEPTVGGPDPQAEPDWPIRWVPDADPGIKIDSNEDGAVMPPWKPQGPCLPGKRQVTATRRATPTPGNRHRTRMSPKIAGLLTLLASKSPPRRV